MRWHWLIAVGAALALAWAGIERLQSSRAAKAERARTAAELQALKAETERLRDQVATLKLRAHDRDRASRPTAAPPPAEVAAPTKQRAALPAPGQEPAGRPDLEAEHRQQLRYANYLDDVVEAEGPDVDDDLTRSLAEDLESVLEPEAELLDLRCNQELCRVQTEHADGDAYRAFQARGFRQDPRLWSGPATFIVLERPEGPDQPLVAAMYLGRGEALPSPEPAR